MQDNTPVYTAWKVFERLREIGYTMFLWPPYSLDLNPIEHLQFHLKGLAHEIHPELLLIGAIADARKAALKETIIEALERLPERNLYLIPALCESFWGGKTKY